MAKFTFHPNRDAIKCKVINSKYEDIFVGESKILVAPVISTRPMRIVEIVERGGYFNPAATYQEDEKIRDEYAKYLPGQRILIGEWAGLDVLEDGEMYVMVKPLEIIAFVDEKEGQP